MLTLFCNLSPLITTERLINGQTYLSRRGISATKTLTGKSMELKIYVPDDMDADRAKELIANAFAGTGDITFG